MTGRRAKIGTPDSPKMVGEPIGKVKSVTRSAFRLDQSMPLHNGDGLSFFTPEKELTGTLVNHVEGEWVTPAEMEGIRPGLAMYRNHDKAFMDQLEKSKTKRKIGVEMTLTETPNGYRLEIRDEDGVTGSFEQNCAHQPAEKPELAHETIEKQLGKLGETEFACQKVRVMIQPMPFLPACGWNDLRRGAVESLRRRRAQQRPKTAGGILPNASPYPETELSYLGNALNEKAVRLLPAARRDKDRTRRRKRPGHARAQGDDHQILPQIPTGGLPREGKKVLLQEPLTLVDEEGHRLRLKFDCGECVMDVIFE